MMKIVQAGPEIAYISMRFRLGLDYFSLLWITINISDHSTINYGFPDSEIKQFPL